MDKLKYCLEHAELYFKFDLEVIIPKLLNYNFTAVNKLGITQNIAVWNDIKDI